MKSQLLFLVCSIVAASLNVRAGDQNDKAAGPYADVTRELNNAFIGALNNKTDLSANAEAYVRELEKVLSKTPVSPARGAKSMSSDELEKLSKNLAGIKELFDRAQTAWKLERYQDAALLFKSVSLATVPGSEKYVSDSRDRLSELETIARKHLQAAGDEEIRREYANEARDLLLIVNEFPDTAACPEAQRLLSVLKSHAEAAAVLELEQAKDLEASGKFSKAIAQFNAIAANPRYQNSIAAIEAGHRAAQLQLDKSKHDVAGMEDVAEREAHALLAASRNLLLNKMNDAAVRKLTEILNKYPKTPTASEAKKLLDDIK
jgi:hypothetical protein